MTDRYYWETSTEDRLAGLVELFDSQDSRVIPIAIIRNREIAEKIVGALNSQTDIYSMLFGKRRGEG